MSKPIGSYTEDISRMQCLSALGCPVMCCWGWWDVYPLLELPAVVRTAQG